MGFVRLADVDRGTRCREAYSSIENTVYDIVAAYALDSIDSTAILEAMSAVSSDFTRPLQNRPTPLSTPSDDSIVRLISDSAKLPPASYFLRSSPGPSTAMKDAEFRDAVWLRLGLAAPIGHSSCTPNPRDDPLGVHRLGCRNSAGLRTQRHDEIVSVIAKAATAADPRSFRVAREERLTDAEDSRARPGDVALDLGDGRCLVDVTVASPFATAGQNFNRISGSPAAAAASAYERKMTKWRNRLSEN